MKNKKILSVIITMLLLLAMGLCFGTVAFAEEAAADTAQAQAAEEATESAEAEDGSLGAKAIAAAIVVGIAAAAGAIAMGIAISKSAESMARQPEASGKINSAMMLGLVFIETLIIYALIVAMLMIFVL